MNKIKCSQCGKMKTIDKFDARRTDGARGLRSACKACQSETKAHDRLDDLEHARALGRASYERQKAARPEEIRVSARKANLKHRHNITPEDFDRLLVEQGGVCAVCQSPATHVDHDHACCPGSRSCGKCIRGLLCGPHNLALGHTKDNPTALRNLATYIEATMVAA